MADDPNPKWTVRTVIADALEEMNPHISGDEAYEAAEGVLSDLAAPEHRDALVACLVEAGIGPDLLTGDERRVVYDALISTIEDYPEQAADRRHEAETSTDQGLLAEADSFDRDCAIAKALLGRIGGTDG